MKVGIISFAHMHAYSYANSLQNFTEAEFTAIYDDEEERGREAADQYGVTFYANLDEFLATDLDAVIICSENSKHKQFVLQSAKAKKHILCEKPIATNLEDAQEMIDVCEKENVILQIAYPVRFSQPMRELKEKIDQGDFGEILAFRTTNRGQNPGGWFIEKDKSGGGAVLDHTVHMVDIMRWYLGEEVTEVRAIADSYFYDIDIDDAGIMTLQFENGVIASHDASWSRLPSYPTWGDVTIEVIGTKKSQKIDALAEHVDVFHADGKPFEHTFYGNDMDYGLIKDFIDCVKEGREPSITGYDGLKSLEVSLAAYESSRKNKAINL